MREKKFTEYIIQTTSVIGEIETIEVTGINKSNYKEMLEVYRDVKEDYKDISCKIDFIGKNDNGQVKVLWSKNNINNEPKEYKEKSFQDIISEFLNATEEKINQCNYEISKLDKETSNTLHKIELVEFGDWNAQDEFNQEKIKLVDELIPILSKRRELKEELKSINQSNIINMSKSICQSIKDKQKVKSKKYTYEKIVNEKSNKIVEVSYKNDKDRIRITSALKRKYGTVNIDESRKIICAYVKRTGKKAI